MSLWWLCYRRSGTIGVVIVEGPSLIHARMRASLAMALTRTPRSPKAMSLTRGAGAPGLRRQEVIA
jgi:hypothetical protein